MAAFSSAGAGCEYMLINHFNLNIFKLIHKVNFMKIYLWIGESGE